VENVIVLAPTAPTCTKYTLATGGIVTVIFEVGIPEKDHNLLTACVDVTV
jgi:hypothetical protein